LLTSKYTADRRSAVGVCGLPDEEQRDIADTLELTLKSSDMGMSRAFRQTHHLLPIMTTT
jgi:hypothetical protein